MATQLKINPQPESLKKKLRTRLHELETERVIPEEVWQDIADYVIPRLWDIIGSTTQTTGTHSDRHKKYGVDSYDGSPQGMLQLLADGLHGYLVSPSIQWFRLKMGQPLQQALRSPLMIRYMADKKRLDEIPEIKKYLEGCEDVMYSTYDTSNFYDAMSEYFLHGGSIGTATMWPEWDSRKNLPVYTVLHPRESYIAEDCYGRVDTLYRKYRMTARQILQHCRLDAKDRYPLLWDATKLSDNVINAINNNHMEQEFEIVHAIFPRSDRNVRLRTGPNKAWASIHFLNEGGDDDDTILNEWGFDRFPALCWRWRKDTGRKYGASPAWDALVDIMGLNTMAKTMLTVANKAADPPMWAPADMRGKLRLAARGINYYSDPKWQITPIEVGRNYPIAFDAVERKTKIIEEHFKVDFFLLLTRAEKTMTATEIIEKQGEKAAVLGSTTSRLQSEAMSPCMDLTFDMLAEAGMLPDPPQILMDYLMMTGEQKIDTVYLGPLAQAQRRLFTSQGVLRSLEMSLPIFQMVPSTLNKVRWNEVIDQIFDAAGMPQSCIVDDEEVEKIEQAQAEMAQRERSMVEAQAGMDMVKTGAEADSATGGRLSQAMQNMTPDMMRQIAGTLQ